MKREESLIQTDTVRVRVMELLPGDATPWHFHREVTDHMVCLTGVIVVHIKQPKAMLEIQPGQRCIVEFDRVHQVAIKQSHRAGQLPINPRSRSLRFQYNGL